MCNSPFAHLPELFFPQNVAKALFSISPGTTVIPSRNWKQRKYKILGGKQNVLWEICKWWVPNNQWQFTKATFIVLGIHNTSQNLSGFLIYLPSTFFLQRYSCVWEHDASFHLPSCEFSKTQSLPFPLSFFALLSQFVNTDRLESLQDHVPSRDWSRYPNQDSMFVKFSRKRCS